MNLNIDLKKNQFEDFSSILELYIEFVTNGKFEEYVRYGNVKPNESAKLFFELLNKNFGWKEDKRNLQARQIIASVNFFNTCYNAMNGLEPAQLSDLDKEDMLLFIADPRLLMEIENLKAQKRTRRQFELLDLALRMHKQLYPKAIILKKQVEKTDAKIEQIFTEPEKPVEAATPTSGAAIEKYVNDKSSEAKVQNANYLIQGLLDHADKNRAAATSEAYATNIVKNARDYTPEKEARGIAQVVTNVSLFSVGNQVVNGLTVELGETEKRGMSYMAAHPNYSEIMAAVKAGATSEYKQEVVNTSIQIAEQLQPYAIAEQVALYDATQELNKVVQQEMVVNHVEDYGREM